MAAEGEGREEGRGGERGLRRGPIERGQRCREADADRRRQRQGSEVAAEGAREGAQSEAVSNEQRAGRAGTADARSASERHIVFGEAEKWRSMMPREDRATRSAKRNYNTNLLIFRS